MDKSLALMFPILRGHRPQKYCTVEDDDGARGTPPAPRPLLAEFTPEQIEAAKASILAHLAAAQSDARATQSIPIEEGAKVCAPAFDHDVLGMPDAIEDVRFDDGVAPPGWARRGGFSTRIISRECALREAARGAIINSLAQPAKIWMRKMARKSRDAFIDLSRAYPPLARAERFAMCSRLRDALPAILAGAHVNAAARDPGCDDFYRILRLSRFNNMWNRDRCAFCSQQRESMTIIVVMIPCEHILCARTECFGRGSGGGADDNTPRTSASDDKPACPLCAIEADALFPFAIGAGARGSSRAVFIDSSLAVPESIIEKCVSAMRDSAR